MRARTCGKCKRVLRYDETLSSCFFEGWGNGQACEACRAEVTGLPTPEPIRYPPGCDMPLLPDRDSHIPICGLCRVALLESMLKG